MSESLGAPEKRRLALGYVRLADSAPLIVAQELRLYEKYQLEVDLHREVSWANVRDKLAVGALDAAPMPAPLPAMTGLGASGIRVPMLSGLTLSLNGNTVTLASRLWHDVRMHRGEKVDAGSTARALRVALETSARGRPTFAVVHAFSTHMILLRTWLRAGGIDPDRDVRTIIVPPAQMADSLAAGVIDGYCVGEPWGSVAVRQGTGAIAVLGSEVWPGSPEKVLCVTRSWHDRHPCSHLRLRLALMEAGIWLDDPGRRAEAADMMSSARYLDLPTDWLLASLGGRLVREPGAAEHRVDDFHVFHPSRAGLPSCSRTELLIDRCGELLGRPLADEQRRALARQTSRPDLFREAAGVLGLRVHRNRAPGASGAPA